jgi:predicted flap endonuclease-1-like 5' DNA nuclease/chromosome segregation ATPase
MDQLNRDEIGQTMAESTEHQASATVPADVVGAARRELEKWRERVPRLVAALRERSEEVERLQAEVGALKSAQPAPAVVLDAHPLALEGVRAREAVIAELEQELDTLREANAGLQGAVHARSLTIGGLKRDLQGWKEKWQELARRLDGAAEDSRVAELTSSNNHLTRELAEMRRTVEELAGERDALAARNADLFETTGFATRQMELLADDLGELRGQLKTLRAEYDSALDACDRMRDERDAHAILSQDSRAEIAGLEAALQTLQAAASAAGAARSAEERAAADRLAARDAEFAQLTDRLAASALEIATLEAACDTATGARDTALAALAEAERLRARTEAACRAAEAACANAEAARAAADAERARAAADAQAARDALTAGEQHVTGQRGRQQQLEHQLEERSALVRSLEQELIGRDQQLAQNEAEQRELAEAQARADRRARESAEYVLQLDGRLERQKDLLTSLETELAAAQQKQASAARHYEAELASRDTANRALQLQVTALQDMLQARDRGGAAASIEAPPGAEVAGAAGAEPARAGRDDQTLRVLNQQLKDTRARNEELLQRVRELETRVLVSGEALADDDLTRIRGVGPRLAQHLQALGVTRYQQIAELEPDALDDPEHALAPLKSRIIRDGWIEQATALFRH